MERLKKEHDEIEKLKNYFCALFPETPSEYILLRCQDLVGKDAAINRFVEELLESPLPPDNWQCLYNPFNIVSNQVKNLPSSSKTISSSTAGPSSHKSAPTSTSISNNSEFDPIWIFQKHEQLISMFPDISPDWLLEQVQNISKSCENRPGTSFNQHNTGHLDLLYERKVEEMFSMSIDDKRMLPTRIQWEETKKKIA